MIPLPQHNRVYGLDILRACAILFVMQSHALRYLSPHFNVHYYWLFILDGVDVFFVLSGFLIGGILLRAIENGLQGPDLWRFWIRRWFRTLPNYFLLLLVLLAGYVYAFRQLPDKPFHFFTFTQCFASPHPHFFPEAWSLAVEEWFYLLVPVALFFVLQRAGGMKRVAIFWFIITVIAAVTLYRFAKVSAGHAIADFNWDAEVRKQVLTRLDAIMYGFLGAYAAHYFPAYWPKQKNLLFILGLLLCFGGRAIGAYNPFFHDYIYLSCTSLGVLCTLPKLSSVKTGKGLLFKGLTFISVISYSMYLLNYTLVGKVVLPGVLKLADIDTTANIAGGVFAWIMFWTLTIGMSYMLYHFYELPMMNLREKIGKVKRPAWLLRFHGNR